MTNLSIWSINYPDSAKMVYPPIFNDYLFKKNNSLVFKTPCNGETTKNSVFPRCELREMLDGKKASWDSNIGKHKFKGIFSVSRFTFVKPEVCVFQIHDGNKDLLQIIVSPDWVKYKYSKFKIVLGSYSTEEKFKIECKVENNRIQLQYNFNDPISLPVDSKTLYFKTGNYLQSNDAIESDPKEYSQVQIFKATTKHFI